MQNVSIPPVIASIKMDDVTLQDFPTVEEMIRSDVSRSIQWKRDYYDSKGRIIASDVAASIKAANQKRDKNGNNEGGPMSDQNARRIPDSVRNSDEAEQRQDGAVKMTMLNDCNYIALDGDEDLFQKISEQLPEDHRYPKEYPHRRHQG